MDGGEGERGEGGSELPGVEIQRNKCNSTYFLCSQ